MPSLCILTDSTVQFPNPVFESRKLVHILPTVWQDGSSPPPEDDLKAVDLPESVRVEEAPRLQAPSVEDFEETFRELSKSYAGVLAILHSDALSPTIAYAREAATNLRGKVPIKVIDSKTVSLGLGLQVQAAADQAMNEEDLSELELYALSLIPRVYTLLCIPGISYLGRDGYLNPSQVFVGEHLDLLPVFTFDEGELVHSEKARNTRHLVDILHEFLAEFHDLDHISLLQGAPAFEQETRALRERLAEEHPDTEISEQIIGAPLASMIGPHSLGIFAIQSE